MDLDNKKEPCTGKTLREMNQRERFEYSFNIVFEGNVNRF
jgi:hypothetical protein